VAPAPAAWKLNNPLDRKPYIRHHPIFGYEHVPDSRYTLPRPGGGTYTVTVNSAGVRASREYTLQKPPGTRRVLAFGDSFAAGQFLSNEHRFSEILERRVPHLEVINFGLEGTGTDQQLLMYQHLGLQYEHDAVLLFPFLQNIRRNLVEARPSLDPQTGRQVLLPKPRFELVDGRLELRNVPVPDERRPFDESDATTLRGTDADTGLARRVKDGLSRLWLVQQAKKLVYPLIAYDPFPEYKDSRSPGWRLMEAILRRFKELAGERPLVIVPLFYVSYVRYGMSRAYWRRFSSLADSGTYAIDVLPRFRRLGTDAVRCFQEPHDPHMSADGHLVLAEALESEMRRLELLPPGQPAVPLAIKRRDPSAPPAAR
jgi:carbamoyltransferase